MCRLSYFFLVNVIIYQREELIYFFFVSLIALGREDPLEKEMAIHSSTIAWKIPWTEEPDRIQSMGSQRVGHDCATSLTHSI